MAKFNLNKGDIISIPLEENLFGFGQIIDTYNKKSGGFLIAIFDYKSDSLNNIQLTTVCASKIVFLGFTFDAKIYHKHWSIIGNNLENIDLIKKPYFKLGTPPDEIYLVDIKGNRLTRISERIFDELTHKTEIAPIRYENALKSHFGLQKWIDEDYDMLLYKHSLRSNEIRDSILTSNDT